jgi:hypothetical protein
MEHTTKFDHDEMLISHGNTTIDQTGECNLELLSLYEYVMLIFLPK